MRDILPLAWQSVCRHKLRGLLAIGGVAIGITAITGIISAESAWSKALDGMFAQLGVTKIAVDPPGPEAEAMRRELTLEDAEAIEQSCSLVKSVVPVSWQRMDLKVGRNVWTGVVKAAGVGIERETGIEMVSGRGLNARDAAGRAPVCLLASHVAQQISPEASPIGKAVRIAGQAFTVVGTFDDRSGDHGYRRAMVGERADAYVPITTAQRIPELSGVDKIIVEADDQESAARQINQLIRHRLRARPEAELAVFAGRMKEAALRSRRRVSVFVGLAGFMALLVAGIGVANLLFVAVAERAREIGLRRAFGASSSAVAAQFLAESLVLCGAGAVVGIGAAYALTRGFFAVAFPDVVGGQGGIIGLSPTELATFQLPGAEPAVAWPALVVAAAVTVLTALLAGIQPAMAAAHLPPAEAIRSSPVPRYRLRSTLTICQVALGVASVLLLISMYEGRSRTELATLQAGEGADLVALQFAEAQPGLALNNSVPAIHAGLSRIVEMLKEPDKFRGLLEDLTLFTYLDPRMQARVSVRAGAQALRVEGNLPEVCGTVPEAFAVDFASARQADLVPEGAGEMMAQGDFLSDRDLDEARPVCVLPHSVAATLFGSGSAVGETVVIAGRPFEVRGVFAPWVEEAQLAVLPSPQKQFPVCVPATTFAREIYDYPDMMDCYREMWLMVMLRVKDVRQGPAAMRQLEGVLLPRLRLPKNVHLYPQGNLAQAVNVLNRQRWAEIRAGSGGVAALLIAIVGLVNMLLVSVQESVREVGLRRALGALRSQMAWQFMREGAMLALAGAVAGAVLAVPCSGCLARTLGVPAHIPATWVVLSGFGAVVSGCAASLGPAVKAARIQPMEALRYE